MIHRSLAVILLCAFAASCGDRGASKTAPQPAPSAATASWQPSVKAVSAESADKTYVASWEPEAGSIPDAEPFNMRFAIRRSDGKPLGADVRFMVDAEMPVVVIAPNDALLEKVKSNIHEVRARGGEMFVFADADSHFGAEDRVHVIRTPRHVGLLSPIVHAIPVQMLAYHTALARGTDVDKPRNLAKSVTVE